MADKRLGIVLEVTEKGLAIFDTAGVKLKEVDRAAIAASVGLGKTLPAASDQAAAGFGRAGAAGAAMGPLIRRGSDLATDSLRKMAMEAAGGAGQLGALGMAADGIGWKGVEEGLENVTQKFGNAMASGTGFKGAMGAVNAELTSLAANPFFSGAILAAAGVQLYKLADAGIKWKEEMDLVSEAQARSETATGRQINQMSELAKRLGTTVGELNEFSTGTGAKGFAALVEHAAKNPEGRIAKAMADLSRETVAAKQATVEHAVAREKTKEELLAEAEAARELARATQDAAIAEQFAEQITKRHEATLKALGAEMARVTEARLADSRAKNEAAKAESDQKYGAAGQANMVKALADPSNRMNQVNPGFSYDLQASDKRISAESGQSVLGSLVSGLNTKKLGAFAQDFAALIELIDEGDLGKVSQARAALERKVSNFSGAGASTASSTEVLGNARQLLLTLQGLAEEQAAGGGGRRGGGGGGGAAPSSAGFGGGLEKAAAALEKASAAIVGFTTGGIKLTTEGGRELGRVVSSFQQRGMSETR